MLAEELADVAPPVPLPAPAAPTTSFLVPADGEYRPTGPVRRGTARHRLLSPARGRQRSSATSAIIGVVIVLVLAAAGVAGWALSHRDTPSGGRAAGRPARLLVRAVRGGLRRAHAGQREQLRCPGR